MPVAPATTRKFRVFWYETKTPRHVLSAGQPPRPLPRHKPTRLETFYVQARSLDTARKKAREYVKKRLGPRRMLLSVNFTARRDELIIYTAEKKERTA